MNTLRIRLLKLASRFAFWTALAVLCPIVSPAWAGPESIYSIVTNPGEDSAVQMNIGWHSDTNTTGCSVTYALKSDANWTKATTVQGAGKLCSIFDGISSKSSSNSNITETAVFLDWGVTLTRLTPNAEYQYKICGSGTNCSAVCYFKTAGAREFSFFWLGDYHAYTPLPGRLRHAARLIDAAVKIDSSVDFLFSTGDVIAWGGSYSFWRDMYEQDFFRKYMFANVIGNHDAMTRTGTVSSDFFRVANHFPQNGYEGQEGVCYWFLYGRVLFLTLNNEVMVKNPAGEQAAKDWAEGVIRKQKGRFDYIFLCEHYQWFDGRAGKTSWYANWKDFCDKHNVALALAGNNHVYQRTHPLRQDKVVEDGQGTIYMVVPSSDGERGVRAGTVTNNVEKLAFTWSDQGSTNVVRTVGGILVSVKPGLLHTRLVHLGDDKTYHVSDETTARLLRADK